MITNDKVILSVNAYIQLIEQRKMEGYEAGYLEGDDAEQIMSSVDDLMHDKSYGSITRDGVLCEMLEGDTWLRTGDANITMITVNALLMDGYEDLAARLNYALFVECAFNMIFDYDLES